MTENRAYSVPKLAEKWSCSEALVYKLVSKGDLRAFRPGGLIRISSEEVERFEKCLSPIASNDSAADLPSSGEMKAVSATAAPSTPKIGRARRPKHGEFGKTATVHRGPWVGS